MTDFQILSERDHVLSRPGMYISSCTPEPHTGIYNYKIETKIVTPGLLKIISEIIDNATDEFIRTNGEYANKIDVSITETLSGTQVTISDNGRGIPQDIINGTPRPVLAWTSLRAGSNFDDSKRVGAGANGLGSVLTNIFSHEFIGTTSNGTTSMEVTCRDNMSTTKYVTRKTSDRGTTVSFIPDLERFGLNSFDPDHYSMVYDRLLNLGITYRGIAYTFNGEKIKVNSVREISNNFNAGGVAFDFKHALFVFSPIGDAESHTLSCVNGIRANHGGTHVDYVMGRLVDHIRIYVKKKHKIDVLPAAIKSNITFASWISNFPALKFDSQSKSRITNTFAEVTSFFVDIDFDKMGRKLVETPSIIDPIIQAILYKKEREEALALSKKQKSASKIRIVNHIVATDPDPEKRSCFIVEGLSAIGSFLSVRNNKLHGALPLRGKVLNVRGMKPVDILKNKEIFELLTVLGLEFNKPAINLNYGKIIFMVDADVDGAGIQCLLLNLFSNWPELFTQGRIYRAMTPLYVCTKGKNTELFYNKTDFDRFNSKGWEVAYCKGLGTMSKDTYEKCINDPFLIKISANDADFEMLEMAFGESADKRKTWMIG